MKRKKQTKRKKTKERVRGVNEYALQSIDYNIDWNYNPRLRNNVRI